MYELASQFEDAFRRLGVRLGQQLAARIIDRDGHLPGAAASTTDGTNAVASERPSKRQAAATAPKILPGLAGRRRKPGETPPICGRPGCDKPSRTRGYCQTHYVQWLRAGRRDQVVS